MSSAATSLEPSSMKVVESKAKSAKQKTIKDLQGLRPKKERWRNREKVKKTL